MYIFAQNIVLLFSLVGCFDYSLTPNAVPNKGIPGAYGTDAQNVNGYPPQEICDDTDNIQVDVGINESCINTPEIGTLDAVTEWRVDGFIDYPEYNQTVMAPVIGQLNDDNLDGKVDHLDYPDIIIISDDGGLNQNSHGVMRMLSGKDGTVLKTTMEAEFEEALIYPYRYSNAALGDIDGDKEPEIVILAQVVKNENSAGSDDTAVPEPDGGYDEDTAFEDNPIYSLPNDNDQNLDSEEKESLCHVVAYNTDFEVEWHSEMVATCGGHAPVLADLEGDGEVEIVVGSTIIRGVNGVIRAKGSKDTGRFQAYAEIGLNSVVSDLNKDGIQEIIAGRTVYTPTGGVQCQGEGPDDGFAAVGDLDMDGYGEFIVVGNQKATIYDTDCTILQEWTLQGGGTGGPPTIADYDGDLEPEIGLVDASTYSVYNPDGSVIWSTPVTDMSSHATGSVVFDFEEDGFPEVVYADELALWVFDGRTGSVRLHDDTHNSRTLHEYPTIADLDNDGSAEIVVVNGGSHYQNSSNGLYVLGSESNTWQASRQLWNQHAYAITNINDDLSIPEYPISNWPTYNNFRSGDVNPISGERAADAIPLSEVCLLECDYDRVVLSVKVANQGFATLRLGLPIQIYTQEDDTLIPIDMKMTSKFIQPGQSSDAIRFRIPKSKIKEKKLFASVDPMGFTNECSTSNNLIQIDSSLCD